MVGRRETKPLMDEMGRDRRSKKLNNSEEYRMLVKWVIKSGQIAQPLLPDHFQNLGVRQRIAELHCDPLNAFPSIDVPQRLNRKPQIPNLQIVARNEPVAPEDGTTLVRCCCSLLLFGLHE